MVKRIRKSHAVITSARDSTAACVLRGTRLASTQQPLTDLRLRGVQLANRCFSAGCCTRQDYTRWAELAGRLAAWAPHLVALDIDDFTSNIGGGGVFTGTSVAKITSAMRSRLGLGRISLCTTAYPLHTEFTKKIGNSIAEATMRPKNSRAPRARANALREFWAAREPL